MAFWFTMLGLVLGSLFGGFWTALIGAVAGYGLARYRAARKRQQAQSAPPMSAPPSAADAPAGRHESSPLAREDIPEDLAEPLDLAQRVEVLEAQVAQLQSVVDHLGSLIQRQDPTGAAIARPLAMPQAVARHVVEPVPEFVPELLPEPALEPRPAPGLEPDLALWPEQTAHAIEPALAGPSVDLSAPLSEPEVVAAQPVMEVEPAVEGPPAVAETPSAPTPEPAEAPKAPELVQPTMPPAPPPAATPGTDLPGRLRDFIFGGNAIVKVGVLILFLGLSFLLKYVAEQVTVPIELRYAGVALLGSGLLGLGWRLRHRRDAAGGRGYGLVLQGAGVGVFYLTTLAAMKLHPLLPVAAGFALLVLVTVLAVVLAVVQNAPWLATVASAAGFLTPVLVSTGSGNHIALFSYLAILDVGIVSVAWFRAWRQLNVVGFVGTFTLASGWAAKHYSDAVYPSTQAFLVLFFLLFTAVGVLFARRALALAPDDAPGASLGERAALALRQVGRVDSALVFGVPLATYGLQYLMVQDDPWLPAASALVMGLFHGLLGAVLWRGPNPRYALLAEAHVVVAVLFGTLSVPLALEGGWTTATWAVEAAGMYWLGSRQHRAYSRAFALALMGLASMRTLAGIGYSDAPDTPWLTGSVLSMVILATSGLFIGLVHRRASQPDRGVVHPPWEQTAVTATAWLTLTSWLVLPWMCLTPLWASVVTAWLATGSLWQGDRFRVAILQAASPLVHVLAVSGFVSTLHLGTGDAMLADGWLGLLAAALIGASLLSSAWLGLRDTWVQAMASKDTTMAPPDWPFESSLALVAGLGLISFGLLYLMPLGHASLVWPILGLAALWAGLKLAHPALVATWAGLNGVAALCFMAFGPAVWPTLAMASEPAAGPGPLGALAFWTPLVLMVSAVVSAAWLHRSARATDGWRLPWVTTPALHLLMLGVSLWWWVQTLPPEGLRLLVHWDALGHGSAMWSLWVTLTSVAMCSLAARLDWSLMGRAAGLTVPAWLLALTWAPSAHDVPPLSNLGWLAWGVALLWHPVALRQMARWWPSRPTAAAHVVGFWLFAWIIVSQALWHATRSLPPATAWRAVGMLAAPLALLALLSARRWWERWPVQAFPVAYRLVAALPLAFLVGCWWVVSLLTAGEAAPLPHVPVLNPLELAQGLALLVLLRWSSGLPQGAGARMSSRPLRLGVLGVGGLAWLTTMVLRACHHWGDVPWSFSSLYASRPTQAALSVTWALVAVGLMILGHRRITRPLWVAGASLLAVVVAKLFFVELADHGGLYRIVSFMAVGVLLLLVGYFAPVPPSRATGARGDAADGRAEGVA